MARKRGEHYMQNQEVNLRFIDYIEKMNHAKENGLENPRITDDIYRDIKMVAERMATRRNFSGYTYKDEMINHAILVCLKAIPKYDYTRATLSGNPNPHGFLSICVWNAFIEIIKKEKKQELIRKTIVDNRNLSDFFQLDTPDGSNFHYIIDNVYNKTVKPKDTSLV